MEENRLLEQIKSAAENAETKDFPGMEKIWNRVEEKLDNKRDKKAVWRWKKIAVAASLLLFGTLGYQFFKNEAEINTQNEVVTTKDGNQTTTPKSNNEVATAEPANPEIKPEAAKILQQQLSNPAQVAVLEDSKGSDAIGFATSSGSLAIPQATAPPIVPTQNTTEKEEVKSAVESPKAGDVELFVEKGTKISNTRKEEPLVVINDKVSKEKLENTVFDADSLVVLKEPLYIINGTEYTEQEVFGPNPTSPYTPLNQQEIESLTVLQNEKAIEIYGNKGKKGVVIITTKNKKPVSASKKAK